MSHHLTLSDRIKLEAGLNSNSSIRSIGRELHMEASSIVREIQRHKVTKGRRSARILPPCANYDDCEISNLCEKKTCHYNCKYCTSCKELCPQYVPGSCKKLKLSPHVCNGCPSVRTCTYDRTFYYAAFANDTAQNTLISSREGINQDAETLKKLDDLVSPLIRKGQPIAHIFAHNASEIGCSRSTLYRYIDQAVLSARNLDLPRKVRYKVRKKAVEHTLTKEEREALRDRDYVHFQQYMTEHPETNVVEMDTVVGPLHTKKVLLTLLFRNCSLMLAFILPSKTQENVALVFDWLCDELGIDLFCKLFPVILTDRGTEFLTPSLFENTVDGVSRTRIFYCDPQAAWQKGMLERNHEFIRYVVPKGTSFDFFEQDDITLMINHINSVGRDKYNGSTPYNLSRMMLNTKIHSVLNLTRIPPEEVSLRPSLLSKGGTFS